MQEETHRVSKEYNKKEASYEASFLFSQSQEFLGEFLTLAYI